MSQKIEIGVNANMGSAENGLQKLDDAVSAAADSAEDVGAAARAAAAELDAMAKKAERVAKAVDDINRARAVLSRQFGKSISIPDTAEFLTNFENMRAGKVVGIGRSVRQSKGFDDWMANYQMGFADPKDAEAHRRRIMNYGMQGTDYARNYRPPEQSPPGQPGGAAAGGGGGGDGGGVQRSQSMALSFGKGMLALAGIGGIMAMAGKAVDLATEESVGIDTLKRRSGDLGVSFSKLQEQARAAGDGLGITSVETVRLANEYIKTAGNMKNLSGVQTSVGFSRAFGLDPATSVQFFAAMQRMRTPGTDDQGSRRLALMVGEAVSKGGYGGKADEVMAAISGLATEMTRNTLAAPNIAAIAGYLTTLTKSGYPGLDPSGAAALLGAADASVRKGGGMGDASLNFSYAALAKASPGLDVVQAGALWQGGLFGTTRGTFGKDTPVGDWYRKEGLSTPGLNDETNLTKELSLMHKEYGGAGKRFMLDAIKNQFGLSYGQAAALDLMNDKGPENLGESQRLVGAAGLKMSDLNASGMGNISRVAAARSHADLKALYGDVMGRSDISDTERGNLTKTFDGGDSEKIKEALTKIIGTHDQEATEGSETRQTIATLQNELTRVGEQVLLPALNLIRVAVELVAQHLAPDEWRQQKQDALDKGKDFHQQALDSGITQKKMGGRYAQIEQKYSAMGGGWKVANMIAPKPTYSEASNPQEYAMAMALHNHLAGIAGAQGLNVSDSQRATILSAAGGDKKLAGLMEGIFRVEHRGQGVAKDSTSPKGAQGFWQFLPSTFAENGSGNIHDFADGARGAATYLRKMGKKYNGNMSAMAAAYNGGTRQGNPVAAGGMPSAAETREYLSILQMTGGLGNTPMPAGGPAGKNDGKVSVEVTLGGEFHLPVKDSAGNVTGTAKLKPFVSKPPSGSSMIGGMSRVGG